MVVYNDNDFQQSIKLNFWPVSRPCQQLKHKNLQSRAQIFKAFFDMRVTIFINFINQGASKMKYWLMSMICLTVDKKENNSNQNLFKIVRRYAQKRRNKYFNCYGGMCGKEQSIFRKFCKENLIILRCIS